MVENCQMVEWLQFKFLIEGLIKKPKQQWAKNGKKNFFMNTHCRRRKNHGRSVQKRTFIIYCSQITKRTRFSLSQNLHNTHCLYNHRPRIISFCWIGLIKKKRSWKKLVKYPRNFWWFEFFIINFFTNTDFFLKKNRTFMKWVKFLYLLRIFISIARALKSHSNAFLMNLKFVLEKHTQNFVKILSKNKIIKKINQANFNVSSPDRFDSYYEIHSYPHNHWLNTTKC